MHDIDLSQYLHLAEGDFLVALQSGTKKLASYHQTWSALPDDLSSASKNGTDVDKTFSIVHFVASRIAGIAGCYLDVNHKEESFASRLHNDCDAMLHQMNVLNLNAQSKILNPDSTPPPSTLPPTPTPNAESSSPPFLAPAYRWLLDNLHNPYPSAEVKARIAAASSCQVSSINSWFINVRRRIGWTIICREGFSNCRADTIDAAYRALVKEDSQRMLSPEVIHSFIAMKATAEGLYSSTFARSAFAGDLDAVVKDMMEEDRRLVEPHQTEETNLAKDLAKETRRYHASDTQNSQSARDSYPSPDRSISTSPVPALDDSITDESEEEDIVPPIVAGSKRRLSSIESANQPSSSVRRPIKRSRTSTRSRTCLPSPPSSKHDSDASSHSPEPSPVHCLQPETNNVLPSRKRRLSDVDVDGIPKCLRGSVAASRPHIVSNPLPYPNLGNEHSIDDWFNANFDSLFAIPPPVDATEPDFSASWEVQMFRDYNIPGNPKHTPKWPPAPAADTQISVPTDLSDLDSLLQSIGDDTFVTPPESAPPADVTGAPYMISFDSSIPDVSQTNIDWTSLLDGTDTYQPTAYSTFPQYPADSQPLPEIDPSMLQLPQVLPTVNSQGDFASKQAKLHRLYTMQEAVRRMEQELQAEGIVI